MKAMQKLVIPESCLVCGDEMTLYTTADQSECQAHESFRAYDGDKIECESCGFRGWMSCDDQIAEANWDETDAHNVKVAEEYEKKRGL